MDPPGSRPRPPASRSSKRATKSPTPSGLRQLTLASWLAVEAAPPPSETSKPAFDPMTAGEKARSICAAQDSRAEELRLAAAPVSADGAPRNRRTY